MRSTCSSMELARYAAVHEVVQTRLSHGSVVALTVQGQLCVQLAAEYF